MDASSGKSKGSMRCNNWMPVLLILLLITFIGCGTSEDERLQREWSKQMLWACDAFDRGDLRATIGILKQVTPPEDKRQFYDLMLRTLERASWSHLQREGGRLSRLLGIR